MIAAVDSPQVFTPIAGAVMLDASGWVTSAAIGETVIVPAGQGATLSGAATASFYAAGCPIWSAR